MAQGKYELNHENRKDIGRFLFFLAWLDNKIYLEKHRNRLEGLTILLLSAYILLACLVILFILLTTSIYFKKHYQFSLSVLAWGAFGFFFFSQVLEKAPHIFVLRPQLDGSTTLSSIFYILYGVTTAAVFEELGRYIILKCLQKRREIQLRDALSYGLGHGGMEMILLGLGRLLSDLFLVSLLANGQAENVSPILQLLLKQLNIGQVSLLLCERILAFGIQILLTIWVFKAVKERKLLYLGLALLFHALIDFLPALVQVSHQANAPLALLIIFIEGIILALLTKHILTKKVDYGIK